MKKRLAKIMSMGAVGMLSVGMLAGPAMAQTTYTPVSGSASTCTFKKFLIMDEGETVPNATFAFTVAPGTAQAAGSGTMEVLAGVGTPTISNVTFSSSDTTTNVVGSNIDVGRNQADRTGTAGGDTVQFDAGEKYAVKSTTVDFSGVSFPEPGVYRYIVTETASAANAAAGIVHDTDTDRVIDVYVVDSNDGQHTLSVAGYVMHTTAGTVAAGANNGSGDVATAFAAVTDKTDGFTNEFTGTKDLEISKTVAGNQGSRDKYFEFTVKATNVGDTDNFVVSLANDGNSATNDGNADATSGNNAATISANAGKSNPTSVTGAQLKSANGVKFYLQHGQSVVIRGLPINATYTVTENAEDYKSTVTAGKTNSGTIGTVAASSRLAEAGFTNTRDGLVPTGVILAVGAPIAAAAAGAGGFVVSKRRRDEDED